MADATRGQLEQAYRLIQQEKLDQAIVILKPIVAAQPNNADAWWLMANAVSEPQDAYEALTNVLRIKPNHPEAGELLSTLKEEFPYLEAGVTSGFADSDPGFDELFGDTAPSGTSAASTTSSSSDFGTDDLDALLGTPSNTADDSFDFGSASSSSSDNLDDLFATDDLFADTEPQFVQDEALAQPAAKPAKPPKPTRAARAKPAPAPKAAVPLDPLELEARANRRPSPFMLLAIVLFVVIIAGAVVAGLFITGALGGQNNAPALDPALVSLMTSTNNDVGQTGLKSAQTALVDSSVGKTFMVKTCSTSGPDLPGRIDKAMDITAKAAATIKDTIQGAGVIVVSCTKPDVTLYRAIAPIAQVVTYVSGNMTDTRTFRSSWVKN